MNEEVRQAANAASDPWAIHWLTYAWVVLMAAWGGLVRFLNSMRRRKESLRDALFTLFSGLVTSVFVGVLTFYACESAGFEKLNTAICVAITGHMGAEGIRILQNGVLARIRAAWLAAFTPPRSDEKDPN